MKVDEGEGTMIGDVIGMLRIAIDRFEEAHTAALVAGERVGTEAMAAENSAWYALSQAEQSAQGGKAAADTVFRSGPNTAMGQQIAEASLNIESAIQDLRRKLDAAHADVDTISYMSLLAIEKCNRYIGTLEAPGE